MIKETSRRKDSCLSRKRSSSNATNIFAESAKENIFSCKYFARPSQIIFLKRFARKISLFNKNFFLWENVPRTWLWHLLVTIAFVWTEFAFSLGFNFACLKWNLFLKTIDCLWDNQKFILLRLMIMFCATSSNFFCVRFHHVFFFLSSRTSTR